MAFSGCNSKGDVAVDGSGVDGDSGCWKLEEIGCGVRMVVVASTHKKG